MNFPLRQLENHLDEASLLAGELLLGAGRVSALKEIDRHLWTAVVEDDPPVEVEVKLSPSRVLAGTCDCPQFRREQSCGHFAAVLLLLRKKKTDEQARRRQKSRPARQSKKFTTSAVLDNVDPEELVEFVRQFARANRNFALALKARFAVSVDQADNKEKFVQVLDSTINAARKADRSISSRGYNKIRKVIGEYRQHIQEAIARHHFREAVFILQSIIERITPILNKLTIPDHELRQTVREAFNTLHEIVTLHAAPALREEVWTYLLAEGRKLTYRNQRIDLLFFRLLADLAIDRGQLDQLLALLDAQEQRYEAELRETTPLLRLRLDLLEKHGKNEAADELLTSHGLPPAVLLYAIETALKRSDYERAESLLRRSGHRFQESYHRNKAEELAIRLAELQGDQPALRSLREERFLRTFNQEELQALKNAWGNEWPQFFPTLIQKLSQNTARHDLIAAMLAAEGQFPRLLSYLDDHPSLDLIMRYDHYLLPEYANQLEQLYRKSLEGFTNVYLGPKSSRRVREMLDHLLNTGRQQLAASLAEELRRTYPERHTLMEELDLLEI